MNLIWSQKYLFYLSEIKMSSTNGFEQVCIFSTFTYNPTYQNDLKTLWFWGQVAAFISKMFLLITKGFLL